MATKGAKVQVKVAGGSIQTKTASTVGELAVMVGAEGYQATVDGEPVEYGHKLKAQNFVSFAKPVKAGA